MNKELFMLLDGEEDAPETEEATSQVENTPGDDTPAEEGDSSDETPEGQPSEGM